MTRPIVKILIALATAAALDARALDYDPHPGRSQKGTCGLDYLAPDAQSGACLECHGDAERGPRIRRHTSHPFDVTYTGGGADERRLRPARVVLARGVLLPGGMVTCTTCHSGRSGTIFRTALPLDEGPLRRRLCNACHDLQGDPDDGPERFAGDF